MKTLLITAFLLLNFSLSAKEQEGIFLSTYQAEQLWDYTRETVDLENFIGKWQKIIDVNMNSIDSNLAGYQSEQPMLNYDGSIQEITIKLQSNPLLPEGENSSGLVTEANIIIKGSDSYILRMEGSNIVYTRQMFALSGTLITRDRCWDCSIDTSYITIREDDFRGMNVRSYSKLKSYKSRSRGIFESFKYGQVYFTESRLSLNVKCGLLVSDLSIMICKAESDNGSTSYLLGYKKQ